MADLDARRQEVARRVIERLRWDGNAAAQAGEWEELSTIARQVLHHFPDDTEALEWLEQVSIAKEVEQELIRTAAQLDRQKPRKRKSGFGLYALLMIVIGVALGGVVFLVTRDQILAIAERIIEPAGAASYDAVEVTASSTSTIADSPTIERPTGTPTATVATPTPERLFGTISLEQGAILLVQPGEHSAPISLLDHEETITLLARSQFGDWMYVQTNPGQKGWLPASALDVDDVSLEDLPVQQVSLPTSTPVPTHTPSSISTPVPAPTRTATRVVPTSTPRNTETPTRVVPSNTSTPNASKVPASTVSLPSATPVVEQALPAPKLGQPANNAVISGDSGVTFTWNWSGTLASDQSFVISVAYPHDGTTWYDIHWLRETSFKSPDYLHGLITGDRVCTWTVTVMRQTGTDGNGQPLGTAVSPASTSASFTWQASAGGSPGGGGAPTRTPRP